ncbi:MAG: glycosyltransferase family 2 protein, partial [Enterococcus sp.]|nr:glycosyltransferase family 2 protein [Enterococcus sp.]
LKEEYLLIPSGTEISFNTYLQMLSLAKWKYYCNVEKFSLNLLISGSFSLKLDSYTFKGFPDSKTEEEYRLSYSFYDEPFGKASRLVEYKALSSFNFDSKQQENFSLEINAQDATLVGFRLTAKTDVKLYSANYCASTDAQNFNNIDICLAMTTYNNQDYVLSNIEQLNSKIVGSKDEISKHFDMIVVDNGRNLDLDTSKFSHVEVFPNKNLGGSGGFARAMIEALRQKKKFSHLLIMDDDVMIIPESINRLYTMLKLQKAEHLKSFVVGAMLKLDNMEVFHEDVGIVTPEGYFQMKKGDHFLDNPYDCAIIDGKWRPYNDQYAGWWFCCIPMSHVTEKSLPLPLFIRGDDVEFALRNNVDVLSMNGICIWHKSFELKFSAAMEHYQVLRNSLVIRACHEKLMHLPFLEQCDVLIKRALCGYLYDSAELILDSIEDYLKGPSFIEKPNGLDIIKREAAKVSVLQDDENFDFDDPGLRKIGRKKYKNYYAYRLIRYLNSWTCNFQAKLNFVPRLRCGKAPYDLNFCPYAVLATKEIYSYDWRNKKGLRRYPDKKKFESIMKRKDKIFERYNREHEKIEREYRDRYPYLTSIEFWKQYLGIE